MSARVRRNAVRVSTHFVLWAIGVARAETQTTEAERRALADAVGGRRRAVEIGVWHGVTTARLKAAMDPAGTLYAVDPFEPGRLGLSFQALIARREVARARGAQVRWVRETGVNAGPIISSEGPVEFVFIDGDHSYDGLRSDWEVWSEQVSGAGVIALHDSVSSAGRPIEDTGSVRFTRERVAVDPRFKRVGVVDSLTLWQRR
jgi:predicted O-methyltransferase YrrM